MSPCLQKTPTLHSLQDGSGREADSIVLAGEVKFLFLLLGSLSDFGINRRTQQAQKPSSLGVCLARRRTTKFVVNHQVDATGTASID